MPKRTVSKEEFRERAKRGVSNALSIYPEISEISAYRLAWMQRTTIEQEYIAAQHLCDKAWNDLYHGLRKQLTENAETCIRLFFPRIHMDVDDAKSYFQKDKDMFETLSICIRSRTTAAGALLVGVEQCGSTVVVRCTFRAIVDPEHDVNVLFHLAFQQTEIGKWTVHIEPYTE